jgi:hypothetical protein
MIQGHAMNTSSVRCLPKFKTPLNSSRNQKYRSFSVYLSDICLSENVVAFHKLTYGTSQLLMAKSTINGNFPAGTPQIIQILVHI